jgi:hypothetical protein
VHVEVDDAVVALRTARSQAFTVWPGTRVISSGFVSSLISRMTALPPTSGSMTMMNFGQHRA